MDSQVPECEHVNIRGSDSVVVRHHFPKENPIGALDEVLDAMEYVGLFEQIENKSST